VNIVKYRTSSLNSGDKFQNGMSETHMGQVNAYKIFIGKSEGMMQLGKIGVNERTILKRRNLLPRYIIETLYR
jgi:hypothetical protein